VPVRPAAARIGDVYRAIEDLSPSMLDRPVRVETQLDPSGTMIVSASSVGREVAFVTSHTVHHNAILRALLEQQLHVRGIELPLRFGLAPSTPSPGQTGLERPAAAPCAR
jgi:hypothetical protein